MAQPTRLTRTVTETTEGSPAVRIVRAFDALVASLEHAGYEDFGLLDDAELGPAIECAYRGVRHVVLVLLVPTVRYERRTRELDAYVQELLDASDDREVLAHEVGDASLDVAQVAINRATEHVSINHLVDILHTQGAHPRGQRFLVPRGGGAPVHICEAFYSERNDDAR